MLIKIATPISTPLRNQLYIFNLSNFYLALALVTFGHYPQNDAHHEDFYSCKTIAHLIFLSFSHYLIQVLLLLITSTVMARPAPDNPLLAFGAGLAVGAVKGKLLAGASRPRSSHYSRGRGISTKEAVLLAGAAGVGLGLIKAGALNGK